MPEGMRGQKPPARRAVEKAQLQEIRLDDLLEVETRFAELAGARLDLDQRVLRDGVLLFHAAVTVALVDRQGRPKRLPREMTARFHASMETGRVTKP